MPAKNSIKEYVEDGYYHIYNRGVEKRLIFLDEQDKSVFLGYLKEYLQPKNEENLRKSLADPSLSSRQKDKILKLLRLNNFSDEVELLAYCLMPNHFHFLIHQKKPQSIDKFINSFCTRYSMYFNKKYKRVGPLYQDVYKAVRVISDEQLLYLTKYIHRQAIMGLKQPSSLLEYLGERNTLWINTEEILSYFSKNNPVLSYEKFINEGEDLELIVNMIIED